MSLKELVTHEVEQLDEPALKRVAVFLSGLKKSGARPIRPKLEMTPEIAALYTQFADEDIQLAEMGMDDYARGLEREDK